MPSRLEPSSERQLKWTSSFWPGQTGAGRLAPVCTGLSLSRQGHLLPKCVPILYGLLPAQALGLPQPGFSLLFLNLGITSGCLS